MIAVALGVFWLDDWLGAVKLPASVVSALGGTLQTIPPGGVLSAAMVVLILLASPELCAIFRNKGVETYPLMTGLGACLSCLMIWIVPADMQPQNALAVYATLFVILFLASLVRFSWGGNTEGAVTAGAAVLFGMMYLGVLPGFYLAIRQWHSAWVVVAVMLITKSCDIGAYFTGRAIGKHKLIPWLSPGKTWEGLAGGLVFSTVLSTVLVMWANQAGMWTYEVSIGYGYTQDVPYELWWWFGPLAGLLLGLLGQFGDLVASLFKRDAGVKDSGSTVPGFGGILDVLDSPIVVAPVAYWLLELAGNAHP